MGKAYQISILQTRKDEDVRFIELYQLRTRDNIFTMLMVKE
jgi:hypothetical protein